MKHLAIALGLLTLGIGAAAPARADFAVAKFDNGSCRVWTDAAAAPAGGHFLWFKHRDHAHFRFATWDGADRAAHLAAAHKRCDRWGWWF